MLSSVHVSLKWATYSFETKPVPNITSSIKYYQNNPLMITDKKLSTFSRPALSVSTEIFKNSNAHATNSTSDDSRHQFCAFV